jgi:hypothetical protein
MKFAYAAIVSLMLVAPALAGPTKTIGQVTIKCEVTGSDKDGFSIKGKNDGTSDKTCSVSCTLTLAGGGTKTYKYSSADTRTVRAGRDFLALAGEGGQPGKPLSNPDVDASCN